MPVLFAFQTIFLLLFWRWCFFHPCWYRGWVARLILFLAPFAAGCMIIWLDLHVISMETLRRWHEMFCMFSTLTVLLLIPQWYKLMWLALLALPGDSVSDNVKLLSTTLFSVIMMLAIIFFFALYYVWLDRLSGCTQGLRSAYLHYQPVILDFPTAFYFSFSCYFSLGYGAYYPYGNWFYLLVFLECLIALINNGIIIFYTFHLLFEKNHRQKL